MIIEKKYDELFEKYVVDLSELFKNKLIEGFVFDEVYLEGRDRSKGKLVNDKLIVFLCKK